VTVFSELDLNVQFASCIKFLLRVRKELMDIGADPYWACHPPP